MKKSTKKITLTAMFAAMASLLMFIEIGLPLMPTFLKMDLSLLPVLIGSFSLGPIAGFMIVLIKDLVHLLNSNSMFVGELSDLFISGSYAVLAGVLYKKNHTKIGAKLSCVYGAMVEVIVSIIVNYTFIIPFYLKAYNLNIDTLFAMYADKSITGISAYLLFGVIPFNLFKCTVISLITFAVYKRISRYIHKFIEENK